MKDSDKIIFALESRDEDIAIDETDAIMKSLVDNIKNYRMNFIDKNILELEIPCEMETINDFIIGDFPLLSENLKNILDRSEVDNIYYKPVYLVSSILNKKYLYWIPIIPLINCLGKNSNEVRYVIGNYKIFRDKNRDPNQIFITEELKYILENSNISGIIYNQVNNL